MVKVKRKIRRAKKAKNAKKDRTAEGDFSLFLSFSLLNNINSTVEVKSWSTKGKG